MAYREQADIYSSLMVESEHLELADSARQCFLKAARPIHAIREYLSVAEALVSLRRIDRGGSIINPKLFINQGPLSVEALRLLEKMPKWIPAFINENPVRSYQSFNINFKLPEGK